MRRCGIALAVLVLVLVIVFSSGCAGNKIETTERTETNPTSTPADPEAVAFHKQGFDAFFKGNYNEALDLYNKSIAADPGYTRAWIDKGNALMALNRSAEAVSVYDEVLARADYLPNVWNSRGIALMATGNYSAARDSFDRVLQLAPDYPDAQANRDIALEKMQQGNISDPPVTGKV
jgi:tetratricopeptide (TPR) repeat protein